MKNNTNKEKDSKRKLVGSLGEELATRFLKNKGFSLVERNYLRKWGEIDIIAKRRKGLFQGEEIFHFVEVKTVSRDLSHVSEKNFSRETQNSGFRPEDNVHPQKLKRLSRAIQSYLAEKRVSRENKWQFDVITVLLDRHNKKAKIGYLENVIIRE